MAILRHVSVDIPESLRLFDLTGVGTDLDRSISYAHRVLANGESESTEANFMASIILYGRAFNGGVRSECRPPIENEKTRIPVETGGLLTAEEYEIHKNILKMRSMHIAHSINDMEIQTLCVWLNPEERGRKVNAVNATQNWVSSYHGSFCGNLVSVAGKIKSWIEQEKSREEIRLKAIIEQRFSLDQLYALEMDVVRHGELKDVAKGRTRTKR